VKQEPIAKDNWNSEIDQIGRKRIMSSSQNCTLAGTCDAEYDDLQLPLVERMVLSIFPTLSTHRIIDPYDNSNHKGDDYFAYETLMATISIIYCRYIVTFSGETQLVRILNALILGYLTWRNEDYWVIIASQITSHFLSFCVSQFQNHKIGTKMENGSKKSPASSPSSIAVEVMKFMARFCVGTSVIWFLIHDLFMDKLFLNKVYEFVVPTKLLRLQVYEALCYLIPVEEVKQAYDLVADFVDPSTLKTQVSHLFFITFHIQVAMGTLGINFLRTEQIRKNALILLESKLKKQQQTSGNDNNTASTSNGHNSKPANDTSNKKADKEDVSREFRRGAAPFILLAAVPYMVQIIFFGGLNMYAFHCFRDDVHRTVRLTGLFDNGGNRFVQTALDSSALSPSAYASEVDKVVSTTYDMFNRKLFSLPKVLLLPSIVIRQPLLLVKIFPFIMLSDLVKARIVATITSEVERLAMKKGVLESKRTRMEQFDLKNSDLIQRSGYGSIEFTERRWIELTEEIQNLAVRSALMVRSRGYFNWLQRNFVMMALVDVALAKLIAIGRIVSADIFVFQRAIEDTIDLLLMRSRAESELATMKTAITKLQDLKQIWNRSEERNILTCQTSDESGNDSPTLEIKGLAYTRGSASVRIPDISLPPGIYAVTGANGSGKSTLFRVLMGCDTNRKSIDIASSINIVSEGEIRMPSSDVVEISQNFYWPLHTKPIDWIYQKHISTDIENESQRNQMVSKVEKELHSLQFRQAAASGTELSLKEELVQAKEDWFSDLSGGQKSKVELVRKVSSL
jgi:ABC-type multidrug transport system fused ATPase/permease subunit